jgi:3'-phosphoadenosine 5'-phosphosulfate sulfotransferase (PAPS reductase)/FAD synthetase
VKHIVNFSGGDCSFWAAHRVIHQYGKENVVLLFADTLIEDEDLYTFNTKAEEILGVKITRVSVEITPWALFRKEGLIANNRFPICSVRLKREPLDEWMISNFEMLEDQSNFLLEKAILYLGFDWTEEHRLADIRREKPGFKIEAPMQWDPIWDKCKMRTEAEALGLPEQKLYKLGFPHNNCGGRCVRAGISHWVHLYRMLPARFLEWEFEEQTTMEDFRRRGIEPLTMLKDRRGGETKNLSLRDLRLRIEAGEKFDRNDWGGCGCGGA